MDLVNLLKEKATIENTKGGEYYLSSYDSNLDLFAGISRFNSDQEIINCFNNALIEDKETALANLLYFLDIRNGKGERRIFKVIFAYLGNNYPDLALKILPFISKLGRYDYILEGLNTKIQSEVITLIKNQIEKDLKTTNPSLLAKWLPSHKTHDKNSKTAYIIRKELGLSEKEYRQILTSLRKKLNIVERNLTFKQYNNIDFNEVPAKAMLKYTNTFKEKMTCKYDEYLNNLKNKEAHINTKGLLAYEIIQKIVAYKRSGLDLDNELYDLMWQNQKDTFKSDKNILVMADTSGSMMDHSALPYATAIGLALYTSERNTGIFKNHFLTFSSMPYFYEIKGKNLLEKIKNIPEILATTDIDKAFELILETAKNNKLTQEELPSHLIIISDMEFDRGVYSENGTNLSGWKEKFSKAGYKLPIIIFWNVAARTNGLPATKFSEDVAMISGFSTNILDKLLELDKYNPLEVMHEKLAPYKEMLKDN